MSETKSLNDKSIEEDSGVDVVLPKVLQAKGVSDCVPARTGTCEDLNMVVLQTFGHLGVKRQTAQLGQVFSSQEETKRWSSSRAIRHHTGRMDGLIQNNYLGRVSQEFFFLFPHSLYRLSTISFSSFCQSLPSSAFAKMSLTSPVP